MPRRPLFPRRPASSLLASVLALLMASPLLASDQGTSSTRRGRRAAASQGNHGNSSSSQQQTAQQQQQQPTANQGGHQGHGASGSRGRAHVVPAGQGRAHGHGSYRPSAPPPASRSGVVTHTTPRYRGATRSRCVNAACSHHAPVHGHGYVVRPRYATSYTVVSPAPVAVYAAPAPVQTYVAPAPVDDRVDLGVGVGLVGAAPSLEGGLPMLTGKLRALGQATPRLGLGLDLDVASLVLVNHATLSLVASYDLTAGSGVALRPYVSLGAGGLNLITPDYLFAGPALSARAGVELKPWRWLGLGVEAGSVASMLGDRPLAVPFAGGTLSLYLL